MWFQSGYVVRSFGAWWLRPQRAFLPVMWTPCPRLMLSCLSDVCILILLKGLARFFEYVAVEALDSSYGVWSNFMSEVFFQAMLVGGPCSRTT